MQENLEIYTMFQYSREKYIKIPFNLRKYLHYFWRENSNTLRLTMKKQMLASLVMLHNETFWLIFELCNLKQAKSFPFFYRS